MIGKRLYREDGEENFLNRIFNTHGSYGTANGKDWFCSTPNGLFGNISNHSVTEHEDGTITVSPSILVSQSHNNLSWHGWLEKGIWRECS
ncbi:MAG TPA: DUF6527 family protein [Methylotenera sp.]|nr:DUF6527 family protein [Methylotenera sp.]